MPSFSPSDGWIASASTPFKLSGEAVSVDKEAVKDTVSPWLVNVIGEKAYPFFLI